MLNNKGFAVTSVLYTLLIAFLLFLGACLTQFSSSTKIFSKANTDLSSQGEALPSIRVYYVLEEAVGDNQEKLAGELVTNECLKGSGPNYFEGRSIWGNIYVVPCGTSFAPYAQTNEASRLETVKFPYSPNAHIMKGIMYSKIKKDNYVFNGWETTINYNYDTNNIGCDEKKIEIGNTVTLKMINSYLNSNEEDIRSDCNVNMVQIMYKAKWEKKHNWNGLNVNVYYNIAGLKENSLIEPNDEKSTENINIKEKYKEDFNTNKAYDGLFLTIIEDGNSQFGLFSTLNNKLSEPSYPIKSTAYGGIFDVKDIIEYENHTLSGWKVTIHSNCNTNARFELEDENQDEITDLVLNKWNSKLDMTCSNPTIKIIYNAIWNKN